MVHELHEGRPDEDADAAARKQQVDGGHQRQEADERDDDEDLRRKAVLPPSWDSLVPDGGEQLLAMWMGDELEMKQTRRIWLLHANATQSDYSSAVVGEGVAHTFGS